MHKQFSHLGTEDRPDSYALMQKSYSQYFYYATGRKGVLLTELNVYLKRRHCLVTLLYDFIFGVSDQLIIDIPLDYNENPAGKMPIELYLCKQRDIKEKKNAYTHFEKMLGQTKVKNYTVKDRSNRNNMIVLSEGEDIANGVIDASVGAMLQKVTESSALKEIHISDMGAHSKLFPLTIHCEIDLPTSIDDASEYENVT